MAQFIDVPGKGVIEFPDDMNADDIGKAIKSSFPDLAPKMGAWDTTKAIGTQLGDAVTHHLPAAVASTMEGADPYAERDWKDTLIERSRAKMEERAKETAPDTKTAIPGISAGDVGNLGPSLAFSAAGMGAGLAAGVPATVLGTAVAPGVGTVSGIAAGGLASGAVAMRQSENQFVRDLRQSVDAERAKNKQEPISDEEFAAKKAELDPLVQEYGLWEAVPEAAGNIAGFGILKAPIAGQIGKLFGKNVATRLVSKAASLYGSELATETVTQQGQHNVEVDAGMGGQHRDWTSPGDVADSFKEVAGPTILQTTIMGAGAKGGMMAYDRLRGEQAPPPAPQPQPQSQATPAQSTNMPRSRAALNAAAAQPVAPAAAAPATGGIGEAAAPQPEAGTAPPPALPAVGSEVAFQHVATGASGQGKVIDASMVELDDGTQVPNVTIDLGNGRVVDAPLADLKLSPIGAVAPTADDGGTVVAPQAEAQRGDTGSVIAPQVEAHPAATPVAPQPDSVQAPTAPVSEALQPAAPVSAPTPTLESISADMAGRWWHKVPAGEKEAIAAKYGVAPGEFSKVLDQVGYQPGEVSPAAPVAPAVEEAPKVKKLPADRRAEKAARDRSVSYSKAKEKYERARISLDGWDKKLKDKNKFKPIMQAEWDRAFDDREKALSELIKADPIQFVRDYPKHNHFVAFMSAGIKVSPQMESEVKALRESLAPEYWSEQNGHAPVPDLPSVRPRIDAAQAKLTELGDRLEAAKPQTSAAFTASRSGIDVQDRADGGFDVRVAGEKRDAYVRVDDLGGGKFQATYGSGTSSPHGTKETAIEWARIALGLPETGAPEVKDKKARGKDGVRAAVGKVEESESDKAGRIIAESKRRNRASRMAGHELREWHTKRIGKTDDFTIRGLADSLQKMLVGPDDIRRAMDRMSDDSVREGVARILDKHGVEYSAPSKSDDIDTVRTRLSELASAMDAARKKGEKVAPETIAEYEALVAKESDYRAEGRGSKEMDYEPRRFAGEGEAKDFLAGHGYRWSERLDAWTATGKRVAHIKVEGVGRAEVTFDPVTSDVAAKLKELAEKTGKTEKETLDAYIAARENVGQDEVDKVLDRHLASLKEDAKPAEKTDADLIAMRDAKRKFMADLGKGAAVGPDGSTYSVKPNGMADFSYLKDGVEYTSYRGSTWEGAAGDAWEHAGGYRWNSPESEAIKNAEANTAQSLRDKAQPYRAQLPANWDIRVQEGDGRIDVMLLAPDKGWREIASPSEITDATFPEWVKMAEALDRSDLARFDMLPEWAKALVRGKAQSMGQRAAGVTVNSTIREGDIGDVQADDKELLHDLFANGMGRAGGLRNDIALAAGLDRLGAALFGESRESDTVARKLGVKTDSEIAAEKKAEKDAKAEQEFRESIFSPDSVQGGTPRAAALSSDPAVDQDGYNGNGHIILLKGVVKAFDKIVDGAKKKDLPAKAVERVMSNGDEAETEGEKPTWLFATGDKGKPAMIVGRLKNGDRVGIAAHLWDFLRRSGLHILVKDPSSGFAIMQGRSRVGVMMGMRIGNSFDESRTKDATALGAERGWGDGVTLGRELPAEKREKANRRNVEPVPFSDGYKVGMRVRGQTGMFSDFSGTITAIDGENITVEGDNGRTKTAHFSNFIGEQATADSAAPVKVNEVAQDGGEWVRRIPEAPRAKDETTVAQNRAWQNRLMSLPDGSVVRGNDGRYYRIQSDDEGNVRTQVQAEDGSWERHWDFGLNKGELKAFSGGEIVGNVYDYAPGHIFGAASPAPGSNADQVTQPQETAIPAAPMAAPSNDQQVPNAAHVVTESVMDGPRYEAVNAVNNWQRTNRDYQPEMIGGAAESNPAFNEAHADSAAPKPTLAERRAQAELAKPNKTPGLTGATKREAMENAKALGYTASADKLIDTKALEKDKSEKRLLEGGRAPIGNPNHPDSKRLAELRQKLLDRDNYRTKVEYNLRTKQGTIFQITKTEYDYFQSLPGAGETPAEFKPESADTSKPEPWRMTLEEFYASRTEITDANGHTAKEAAELKSTIERNRKHLHKQWIDAIRAAADSGKEIPASVLNEVPGIARDLGYHVDEDGNVGAKDSAADERFDVDGVTIYTSKTRDGDMRWLVQVPENAGTNKTMGDTIHKTRDDAIAFAKNQAARQKEREESLRRIDEQDKAEAAKKAEREDLDGFADDMTAMQRGRVVETLSTLVSYRGRAISRRDLIREKVSAGAVVREIEGGPALESADESFLNLKAITKIGMQYAEYLISRRTPSTNLTPRKISSDPMDGTVWAVTAHGQEWQISQNKGSGGDAITNGWYATNTGKDPVLHGVYVGDTRQEAIEQVERMSRPREKSAGNPDPNILSKVNAAMDKMEEPAATGAKDVAIGYGFSDEPIHPKWATDHEADVGGRVVYSDADVALLEGFSIINGRPAYAAIKRENGQRTRVDIESYTGPMFTDSQRQRLIDAKAAHVAQDAEKHADRPDGPFADGQTLAASDGVPSALVETAREWLRLLGVQARVVLVTTEDARDLDQAAKHGWSGPYAAIRSAGLDANENGSTRRLANGDHYIAIKLGKRQSQNLEILAHEIGHILEKTEWQNADAATKESVVNAYNQWLKRAKETKAADWVRELRAHTTGKLTKTSDIMADQMPGYWRSFGEFFADQVAKWATSSEAPVTAAGKFFKRVADGLRRLYASVAGKRYLPIAEMKAYLDSRAPADVLQGEQAQGKPDMIQDAGEKIGGARKDVWALRGLNLDDLDAMSHGEAAQYVTKDAVWPKPDYAALVADGMPAEVAAMVKIIRDRLGAKPVKDTPEGRRHFVEMMTIVREELLKARSEREIDEARKRILYDRLGWPKDWYKKPDAALSNKLFSIFKGQKEQLGIKVADRRKAKAMVESGFPGEVAPWMRNVQIQESSYSGPFLIRRNAKFLKGGFQTAADAEAWLKAEYDARRGNEAAEGKLPSRPHLDNLQRSGADVRAGRDVDSQDFITDFGFRGVEFGNWVASDERQKIVNLAYEGLHDLANVLGIPPKALSLNGTMGMAFGARGSGRALAHYEPGKLVINMTKLSGAGSLAHEWAHAVDHYFGELDQPNAYQGKPRGASGWYEQDKYDGNPRWRYDREKGNIQELRLSNLRPEMAQAFDTVMRALFKRDQTKAESVRERELALEKTQAQIDSFTKQVERHRARPEKDQQPKWLKQAEDWLASMERVKLREQEALAEARGDDFTPTKSVESSYYENAKKLSGKSGSSGYWARPTEMFARAFESYVFDKIKAQGGRSDYLVHGVEGDRYSSDTYKGNPYPAGEERAAINAAFDALVQAMDTREGKDGIPALFDLGEIPSANIPADAWINVGDDIEVVPLDVADTGIEGKVNAFIRSIAGSAAVPVRVYQHIRGIDDSGVQHDASGVYFTDASGQRVIALSVQSGDIFASARHEAIHLLRESGALKKQWGVLERHAAEWRKRFNIDRDYAQLADRAADREDFLNEEAVGDAYKAFARGELDAAGVVARAFQIIRRFVEMMSNAMRGRGFTTAKGVFSAIERGDLATRAVVERGQGGAKFSFIRSNGGAMTTARRDLRAILDKLLKPEQASEGVMIQEAETADDISWFKAKFYTPEAIFRRLAKSENPKTARVGKALYALWEKAVKAETDQSEYLSRLRRDLSAIRDAVDHDTWVSTQALLFQGDAAGVEYSREQTDAMVESGAISRAAADTYHRMRSFFKKLGEFVDQHERKMKPQLRKQKFSIIRKMARRLGVDEDNFRRRYAVLSDLRAQFRQGDGDPEYLASRIAEEEAILQLDENNLEWEVIADWDRQLQAIDRRLSSLSVQRREGYIPHKFYGSWAVYEVVEPEEEGGEVSYKLLPAYRMEGDKRINEGFHQTRDDAVRAANQHAVRNQDKQLVVRPVEFKFPGDNATVVSDASMRHAMRNVLELGEQVGLGEDESMAVLNGVVKTRNRRRHAGFKQFRQGVEGYSNELDRVLDTHVGEVIRYVVMDELKYEAINTFERTGLSRNRSVIQENPTLATMVEQWFQDINGQKQATERQLDALFSKPWAKPLNMAMLSGTAAFLATGGIVGSPAVGLAVGSYVGYRFYRGLKDGGDFKTRAITGAMLGDMSHLKLGAFTNVMSAVVNLSQTAMNTWPILGSKWTAVGIKRYTKAMADQMAGRDNPDIALLRRGNVDTAFKTSEISPHLFDEEGKLARASMFLFTQAESLNRGVALLGAYAKAEADGAMPGRALRYAKSVLLRTQFHYGPANKPEVLRNTLLRVPLQFKNFLAQQLTFISGLNRAEGAKFMLALFLMAGLLGMPGAELLDDLTDAMFGFSPIVEIKRMMFNAAAEGGLTGGIATALVHGLPALFGIDISSRVGLGDSFPKDARDFKGPWLSTIETAAKYGAENASIIDQIKNLTPGIGSPLKVVEAAANGLPVTSWPAEAIKAINGEPSAFTDGKALLTNPNKRGRVEYAPTSGELALKAIGGRPTREAKMGDANEVFLKIDKTDTDKTRRYVDEAVRAIKDGDYAAVQGIVAKAREENVDVTSDKIRHALEQANKPRLERLIEQMPPAERPWAWQTYRQILSE